MPLIVDTYNVLHVTGVLHPELAGVDVAGLASLIAVSRYGAETVWLVCDGVARPGTARPHGRIVMQFSGGGRSADDHIGRMIDTSTAPRRLTVVSSDLRVGRMARRRRCRWLRSEEFLERIEADVRGQRSPSPRRPAGQRDRASIPLPSAEVERWIRHFDLDEVMASLAPAEASPATDSGGGSPNGLEAAATNSSDPRTTGPTHIEQGPNARTTDWESIDLRDIDVEGLSAIDFSAVMSAALARIPPSSRRGRRDRGRGR